MNIFGQRIHWTETGNGAPVILLHGLGSDSSEWARATGWLSARRRVLAFDQIGFGQSGKPALRYRVDTLCSFLEGFYEGLKIERASLVAHGFAGAVAVAFATSHPRMVERLVLVGSGFLLENTNLELLNPMTRHEAAELAKRTRFAATHAEGDYIWADSMASAGANQALIDSARANQDSQAALVGKIAHPTLVIWGREDRLTPLEIGERTHAAIPASQMVIIEKAGHAPQREQPKEFAMVVDKFLSGAQVHQRFRKQRQEENVWF